MLVTLAAGTSMLKVSLALTVANVRRYGFRRGPGGVGARVLTELVRAPHFGHAARTLIRSHVLGRCGVGLPLMLLALGLTRKAAAFPTSRLVYARGPGAEQCPDQDSVRKAVATRLGYDPFFPGSDKTIVARITRESERLRGTVELNDEHGTELGLREFSAEPGQCDDLVRAMALSISIAIDPKSAETYAKGPADEPPPAEPEPEAPEPPPPPRVAPKPAPNDNVAAPPTATGRVVAWSAGLGVMSAFGVAPSTTLAGVIFAAVRAGAGSVALEARANPPVTTTQSNMRFKTWSAAFSVVPCAHLKPMFACEVTSLGWLNASGTPATAKSGTSALFSLGGRLGAELPVTGSAHVVAAAQLLANPWPVSVVAPSVTLWQAPTVTVDLELALAFHF
jgi:hypothetical protein